MGEQIGRPSHMKAHRFLVAWMRESQLTGVQKEAPCRRRFAPAPVDWIRDDWKSHFRKMHSDLMGAARLQAALHPSEVLPRGLFDFKMGDREFAGLIGRGGKAFSVLRMPCQMTSNRMLLKFWHSPSHCPINSVNGFLAELFCQGMMRVIVLGDHQHAAGVPIEAMHDPGPILVKAHRHRVGKRRGVMQEHVDQSVLRVSRGRVHDESTGFVYYDEVLVFKQDVERSVQGEK